MLRIGQEIEFEEDNEGEFINVWHKARVKDIREYPWGHLVVLEHPKLYSFNYEFYLSGGHIYFD